jgi:hypothetical protein
MHYSLRLIKLKQVRPENLKPKNLKKKEDGVRREERTFGGKCKAYCVNIKPQFLKMKPTKANSLNNI